MKPSDRRSFLAGLGRAGAFMAAGPWLRALGYAQGGRGPARALAAPVAGPCRSRSPPARFVPGAPRPGDLHRRLRAGLAARRCQGIPHRRRARDQRARRADRSLSGRQLRLRLQLARRRRPEGPAADRARSGLELDRDEPVRHQRVHRLVRAGRRRAAARHELRHRHGRDRRSPTSSTATSIAARSGATCGARTATSGRTTCATGASATRWTARGRSASCRRASTGARRATPPGRCASSIRRLQLIACGSSGTFMPTYLAWDREVLEECYDQVDGISLHAYYGNTAEWSGNSAARYLAMNLDMDRQIHEIAAVCDYVQGLQRSASGSGCRSTSGTSGTAPAAASSTERPTDGRAAPARGGLQPRGRAARRRLRQHAAAQFGSRARRRASPSSST